MQKNLLLFTFFSTLLSCKTAGNKNSGVKDSPSMGGSFRLSCAIYYHDKNGSPIYENWDAIPEEERRDQGIGYTVDYTDPKTSAKLYVKAYAESMGDSSERRYFGTIEEVRLTAPNGESAVAKTDGPLRPEEESSVLMNGVNVETPNGIVEELKARCRMFVYYPFSPED
ncbi:MAG: hypothetical protein AB7T49_19195 [Oligoflexales bacterium]